MRLRRTTATTPTSLLKNADMALYRAKEDGRGAYRFFEPEWTPGCRSAARSSSICARRLRSSEFELFYQPLVDLATNKVSCFEALLRWRHPERGMVTPDDFIPLAEEIGLIGPIGAWVLKKACAEAIQWPARHPRRRQSVAGRSSRAARWCST